MGYKNLQACVQDLLKHHQLLLFEEPVDPNLEVSAIQRRVCENRGPAILFTKVKNSPFPMLGNLFGTEERCHFLFRDTLDRVQQLFSLKADPTQLLKHPGQLLKLPRAALHLLPKKVKKGPILAHSIKIHQLPHQVSWPQDGGAFITLPIVYTESIAQPGLQHANLGMYRIQLSGGQYVPDEEIGLHYQIHRGIGIHQTLATEAKLPFRVNIFVGGAPALSVAAVMPMPEDMSELTFAGLLGGRRVPMIMGASPLPIYAEADFCIAGTVIPGKLLPEGPFGDHLGYYSLTHDYPVLKVENVYHRPGAIWPFTTVGRPPQEDSTFGKFIHELTAPLIPSVVPGVRRVHAVDEAGVHPLLLAIGSERYTPYKPLTEPQEILTQSLAILGQGQLSLAKYLFIAAQQDNPHLDLENIPAFFEHMLSRIDFRRDVHFQTQTTIDTLDYSGHGFNKGSKVVLAAVGLSKRKLATQLPSNLNLPNGFKNPRVILPGILGIEGATSQTTTDFCQVFKAHDPINQFPLIIIADNTNFLSESLRNFLWVTFTRSNPATDIDGIESFTQQKHWGCAGSLVIDARAKPHHAPVLMPDPAIEKRVDAWGVQGQPLHGII
ncbi:MAG: UbiD family decarboxylase [Deltaproteobacteria bacterium]|nr:UbiD family decarboxylase [Deltaproteobacteria bacterium]